MNDKLQPEMVIDWTENYIELDTGVTLAYMTCGPANGSPLVFIHGATDSRYSWSQLAPLLANEGYRCYILELRGHGSSTKTNNGGSDYNVKVFAKDIISFFDKLNLNNFSLIGNSLGSFIIQELLISIPKKINKAVLLASGLGLKDNVVLNWLTKGGTLEVVNVHFAGLPAYKDEGKLPDAFLKVWAMTSNEDRNFANAIYQNAKSLPYETWVGVFENTSKFYNEGRLSNITQPLLIIWGSDDAFFTKEERAHFLAQFESASIKHFEIEGGSHNVHWDSKKNCNIICTSILKFLNEE